MITAFIDESGDLGSVVGSSRNFIVVAVLTENPEHLRRAIRRVRDGIRTRRVPDEIHWHASDAKTRKQVLTAMNACDLEIHIAVLQKTTPCRQEDREDIYRESLQRLIRTMGLERQAVTIIIDDRQKGARARQHIQEAIINAMTATNTVRIQHLRSTDDRGLQAADAIAGAAYRKYEYGDASFLELVQGSVTTEALWKRKK